MKRILFMHQVSSVGGGSYCLLNILKSIDRENIEPVVCLASEGPLKSEIEKLGIEAVVFEGMQDIPYNKSLASHRSVKSYYRIHTSIPQFRLLLKEKQIDVLYLNNMMLYRYLKPAKQCGCKTILHCREHWPLNEHKLQLRWARNAVYKYVDELVAINHYSASIFPQKQATIVYDWIDMDSRYEHRPMSEILGEDASNLKVYLYTGGYQIIKGCLEVLSTFSKYVNDPNARLLAMGVRPDIKINKYKLLLAKYGLKCYTYRLLETIKNDSRIHCVPSTYMLSHIMQQCYCNISYFTIPHANLALAEGEILGLPAIAADTDESREYSLNGSLSLLYKFHSLKSFRNAIQSFDERYNEFKSNMQKHSSDLKRMFDKNNNIKIINSVLNQI